MLARTMHLQGVAVVARSFIHQHVAGFANAVFRRNFHRQNVLKSTRNVSVVALNTSLQNCKIYTTVGGVTTHCRTGLHLLEYNQQRRTFTENRKTKALTLFKDLKHLRASPAPALVFGISGLIPFVAAPTYMIMSGSFIANIAFSQVAYGACILSFLGGVRWGLTIPEDSGVSPNWFNLGYSITPSLVAWLGLMLPTSMSILTLMAGLTGAAYMDLKMWGYPEWFKALRFLLSFIAVLALWTTFMCKIILNDENTKKAKTEKKIDKVVKVSKQESTLKPQVDIVAPVISKPELEVLPQEKVLAISGESVGEKVLEEEIKELKD